MYKYKRRHTVTCVHKCVHKYFNSVMVAKTNPTEIVISTGKEGTGDF